MRIVPRRADEPRFGFTITQQVGKAVERNRIRRRLKAAVRDVGPDHARREFDYVLIARRPALTSAVRCPRERARQGIRARAPRAGAGAVSRDAAEDAKQEALKGP